MQKELNTTERLNNNKKSEQEPRRQGHPEGKSYRALPDTPKLIQFLVPLMGLSCLQIGPAEK